MSRHIVVCGAFFVDVENGPCARTHTHTHEAKREGERRLVVCFVCYRSECSFWETSRSSSLHRLTASLTKWWSQFSIHTNWQTVSNSQTRILRKKITSKQKVKLCGHFLDQYIRVCVCVCFERCCAELGNFLEQPLNTNDLLVSSMNKTLFKLNCIENENKRVPMCPQSWTFWFVVAVLGVIDACHKFLCSNLKVPFRFSAGFLWN